MSAGTQPAPPRLLAPEVPDTPQRTMRIGEVAERAGTTVRTIRYYEEIGLLGAAPDREQGKHRSYTQADVERVSEIIRLRDLLGVSLEQLAQLVEAETARAAIRREYRATEDPARQRELLAQSQAHIATQLKLVQGRLAELSALERELLDKAHLVVEKLARLDGAPGEAEPVHAGEVRPPQGS